MTDLNEFEQRELMVRVQLPEADPIWGQQASVYDTFLGYWIVSSVRCGTFRCAPNLRQQLQNWSPVDRAKLTTWISDQNMLGIKWPALSPDALDSVMSMRPMRFAKKNDRFFQWLARIGYRPGGMALPFGGTESVGTETIKFMVMRWTEAVDDQEYHGLVHALATDGLITDAGGRYILTARGLNRLDDVDALGAANDQAFVAMWFDPSMEAAFEEGIAPGLKDAGYQAFRIDRKEHANKIDDEIVAEIRRSRFIVADFTCGTVDAAGALVGIPRGGVYYEAGLAQGLGMPVIWTVRADQIGLVHFDTRQFNHITWEKPEDLRKRIYQRVAAVIGEFTPQLR